MGILRGHRCHHGGGYCSQTRKFGIVIDLGNSCYCRCSLPRWGRLDCSGQARVSPRADSVSRLSAILRDPLDSTDLSSWAGIGDHLPSQLCSLCCCRSHRWMVRRIGVAALGVHHSHSKIFQTKERSTTKDQLRAMARGFGLSPEEAARLLTSSEPHRAFARVRTTTA